MNLCKEMMVGNDAGDRRKLLSIDSSVGAMIRVFRNGLVENSNAEESVRSQARDESKSQRDIASKTQI